MKALDLFGNMTEMEPKPSKGYCQRFKIENAYREADDKQVSCKFCTFLIKKRHHHKIYYKCNMLGDSASEATDIRLKMVCNKFVRHED